MTTVTLPRAVVSEALKILSALVDAQDDDCGDLCCDECEHWRGVRELVERLRAVLAEPASAPAPVAWSPVTGVAYAEVAPPKREPLTDEEIANLKWEPSYENPMTLTEGLQLFARAVERWHGITGDAA